MSDMPTRRRALLTHLNNDTDMTIGTLLDNARRLNDTMKSGAIVRDVLMSHQGDIMDLQRRQLLEGKTSGDIDIRPYYSEDVQPSGWFTTATAAKNYAAWKTHLSYPESVDRNPDAPNLYITGKFYDDLRVSLGSDAVEIVANSSYGSQIMAKYGRGIFGLCMRLWGELFDDRGGRDELLTKMKETLWQG